MVSKIFTQSSVMPTVRSGELISYNLKTHGTVEFDQNISKEGLEFLAQARSGPIMRKIRRQETSFRHNLEKDGYDPEELMSILNLIEGPRHNSIRFKSDKTQDRHTTRLALRGLDVLSNLSVLGKNLSVTYGFMQFRITENEVRKTVYENGVWMVTTGWLMPVWSEKSYTVS